MQKRIQRTGGEARGWRAATSQFLDALLKLRQACIDPRLVKLDKAAGIHESTKLEWLREETVPQLLEEGPQPAGVFPVHRSAGLLVESELKSRQGIRLQRN